MVQNRRSAITYEVYRPLIRLAVGLIILVLINWLLTSLPMISALSIPRIPVSINAIISMIIGIIMISLLFNFRQDFVPRLEQALPTFKELAEIVHAATSLGMIVVAYVMFDDVILPFMSRFTWVYPLVFLLIALWPLVILIVTLIRSSGKIADMATFGIAKTRGEVLECPHCHAIIPGNASYCPNCSDKITVVAADGSTIKCATCGIENRIGDTFCLGCGKPLSSKETKVSKKTT